MAVKTLTIVVGNQKLTLKHVKSTKAFEKYSCNTPEVVVTAYIAK